MPFARRIARRNRFRGLIGFDVPSFIAKMGRYKPAWVVFHGKEAAKHVSKHLRKGNWVPLGPQSWTVAEIPVFVLPSASAANQNPAVLEGKRSRVEWFKELATLLPPLPGGSSTTVCR